MTQVYPSYKTCQEKYGCGCYQQTDEFKLMISNIMLSKAVHPVKKILKLNKIKIRKILDNFLYMINSRRSHEATQEEIDNIVALAVKWEENL